VAAVQVQRDLTVRLRDEDLRSAQEVEQLLGVVALAVTELCSQKAWRRRPESNR